MGIRGDDVICPIVSLLLDVRVAIAAGSLAGFYSLLARGIALLLYGNHCMKWSQTSDAAASDTGVWQVAGGNGRLR